MQIAGGCMLRHNVPWIRRFSSACVNYWPAPSSRRERNVDTDMNIDLLSLARPHYFPLLSISLPDASAISPFLLPCSLHPPYPTLPFLPVPNFALLAQLHPPYLTSPSLPNYTLDLQLHPPLPHYCLPNMSTRSLSAPKHSH